MSTTAILIELMGAIALLMWGIGMISNGVQNAFGGALKHWMSRGLANRWRAFFAGLAATALLQSSTATALMVTSFTAGGLVELAPALAVMLGANVGTTLVVQVVSFDINFVYPLLILTGVGLHSKGRGARLRESGRALIGLGLMLLALHIMLGALGPVAKSPNLAVVLHIIASDRLVSILVAALFALIAHSSVAAMLLVMSLAGAGVIDTPASLAMVLGANLGSALNPIFAARGTGVERLRLPIGNLLTRLVGIAVFLPLLNPIGDLLTGLGEPPARLAAEFHTLFNLATALMFIGPLPRLATFLVSLLPARAASGDPGAPQHLDHAALATPFVAVSNAARETLRMADVVETMLRGARDAFQDDDPEKVAAISRMDDTLDRLYGAIQRYLGVIGRDPLGEAEARRVAEIMVLAINLEHIGDIIDKNLMELASKRIKHHIRLPPDQRASLDEMHARLVEHLQLAMAVFIYGDVDAARRLVAEKEQFRDIEREATRQHFEHMRTGETAGIEVSALLLDVTRDLKRIEAHIAATAYGLLERSGLLKASRLEA